METLSHIRNFSIIAHIDHGKSTLADRFLEVTHTIEARKMKEQVLDQMELERERGITIKMQPVTMNYDYEGNHYLLNLIDTPGHIDFSYEVSRALSCVEGVILLIDATQGVQAQTLTTLHMAQKENLAIIPVLNKIDLPNAQKEEVSLEVMNLLGCAQKDILYVSGKTGEGVSDLLHEVIKRIPPPSKTQSEKLQALIFDFEYSNHQGVIVYARIMDGEIKKGDTLYFLGTRRTFTALEIGIFVPEKKKKDSLKNGEIGYIVTGVKEPRVSNVGDTITFFKNKGDAVPGFQKPRPVVWASLYPEGQDDFEELRQALARLSLSDSSFFYEEEGSGVLGRGFRIGFLGMLHLEIIFERVKREFKINTIVTNPTITYEVSYKNGQKELIYSPSKFPNDGTYEEVREPWISAVIITPPSYVGGISQLLYDHEGVIDSTDTFGHDRIRIFSSLPLRELMRNFFDELKSATSGFASLSYEVIGMKTTEVFRMDVLIAEEETPALARIVSGRRIQKDSEAIAERLKSILPRQLFPVKIQVQARGRIVASRTIPALKKNVTGYLYGGDITRKKKLWEKQKRGKKRLAAQGKVHIPHDVFLKMMKESPN